MLAEASDAVGDDAYETKPHACQLKHDDGENPVVGAVALGVSRSREYDHPEGQDSQGDPLSPGHLEAEESLREQAEQHEATREHRLGERQWGQRQCTDVKEPGNGRCEPSDREPLGAEQCDCRLHRVMDVHVPDLHRPLLLPEPGHVRASGACQCEQQADDHTQMH